MRRTRYEKYRRRRRRSAVKVLSILALSTFGMGQLTRSSYALLLDQTQVQATASAAFVFPETIEALSAMAKKAREDNLLAYQTIQSLLVGCMNAGSYGEARTIAQQILDKGQQARRAVDQANEAVRKLTEYSNQSRSKLNKPQQVISQLESKISTIKGQLTKEEEQLRLLQQEADQYQFQVVYSEAEIKDKLRTCQRNVEQLQGTLTALQSQLGQSQKLLLSAKRVQDYVDKGLNEAKPAAQTAEQYAGYIQPLENEAMNLAASKQQLKVSAPESADGGNGGGSSSPASSVTRTKDNTAPATPNADKPQPASGPAHEETPSSATGNNTPSGSEKVTATDNNSSTPQGENGPPSGSNASSSTQEKATSPGDSGSNSTSDHSAAQGGN